jgi:hypothetical protein
MTMVNEQLEMVKAETLDRPAIRRLVEHALAHPPKSKR